VLNSYRSLTPNFISLQTGSYFGSVLCAVDIETTKSDVLVVGAPFYGNLTHKNIDINHINQDEGKVYVYYFDKAEVSLNKWFNYEQKV
jgi:hypothetical protein